MVKFLIVTFNAFLLFVISFFAKPDGIGISANFPTGMKPGSEVDIELRIKKGGMGGFAKMQLEVPEGFSATEIDSKGANFSYNPGLVKWIWPALPGDDEIVLKFKLKADASMNGTKTITGKFSYVENNAKQVVDMPNADIIISNDGGEVAVSNNNNTTTTQNPPSSSNQTVSNTPKSEPPVAETKTQTPPAETPTTSLNDEPPGNVTVVRYIKPGSNPDEHLIELKISKGNIRGFAKHSDDLPSGYTAKSVKTAESSFSVADGKIKFVWVTLPNDEEITISYLLSGRSSSMVELKGEFSYLANDQSKKFIMQKVTLPNTPSAEQVVSNAPTVTQTPVTKEPAEDTSNKSNNEPTAGNNAANTYSEQPATDNRNNTENPSTKATRVGEINYRVQIGAFSNPQVTAGQLKRQFGVSGDVISEMHNGLNKFMTGNHGEYKQARDHRDRVRNNIRNAFVVAYNGPKRITVQEALMVTNQKWFK